MRIKVTLCKSLFSRLCGLLKANPSDTHAICILPCSSIHTFGMRYRIDVCFCDCNLNVMKSIKDVRPSRYVKCPGAYCVIERPASLNTWPAVGQRVELLVSDIR